MTIINFWDTIVIQKLNILNLKNNNDLKLSDVFKYYYLDELGEGINLGSIKSYSTKNHRWLILAIHFNLVKKVRAQFRWLPTSTIASDVSEWYTTRNDLLNRMYYFSEFWYNKFKNNQFAILETLLDGTLSLSKYINIVTPDFLLLLKNNTNNQSIRFERVNKLSLPQLLSEYIENKEPVISGDVNTSAEQLDWTLDKFLSRIKTEFENEKQRETY